MSIEQLAKLEALSQTRVDQVREAVERQNTELSMIDQQHHELKKINQEYQYGVVGQDDITPSLLAHRRAFVAQLSEKLDLLSVQREQKNRLLQKKLAEQQERTAQTAAIGCMVERQQVQQTQIGVRQEQHEQDESIKGLQHRQRLNEEGDHA